MEKLSYLHFALVDGKCPAMNAGLCVDLCCKIYHNKKPVLNKCIDLLTKLLSIFFFSFQIIINFSANVTKVYT